MAKNWFEATVRYERMKEDGNIKMVTEKYLIESINPTEAEAKITDLIAPISAGEVSVKSIIEQKYQDYVPASDEKQLQADEFWCATIELVTIDERTAKEKKSNFKILLQAVEFHNAVESLEAFMCGSVMDYSIVKIEKTKLIDVYTK